MMIMMTAAAAESESRFGRRGPAADPAAAALAPGRTPGPSPGRHPAVTVTVTVTVGGHGPVTATVAVTHCYCGTSDVPRTGPSHPGRLGAAARAAMT